MAIAQDNLSTLVPDGTSIPTGWTTWPREGKAIRGSLTQKFVFSGPNKGGEPPILTLADEVSTWETGDKIVVASTSWDPRESETFSLVDCPMCDVNQGMSHRNESLFLSFGSVDDS